MRPRGGSLSCSIVEAVVAGGRICSSTTEVNATRSTAAAAILVHLFPVISPSALDILTRAARTHATEMCTIRNYKTSGISFSCFVGVVDDLDSSNRGYA